MNSNTVVDRGSPKEISGNEGKKEDGKVATVTEIREHRVEERAGDRHAFNGTVERGSLFTVANLCSQTETARGTDRRKDGG